MKRLKTFFIYALIIAAFWFLSDFLIYMAINGSYKTIETRIMTNTPNINVSESKATYINGYVKGNVYNNTDETIENKYIKIDFYSPRDICLGTKYITIENLEPENNTSFEMWFKYTDVEYCIINYTDNAENSTEEQFISEETQYYLVVGALFMLYFF